MFTPDKVKKITGASRHEPVNIQFYYSAVFLDKLREQLEVFKNKTKVIKEGDEKMPQDPNRITGGVVM